MQGNEVMRRILEAFKKGLEGSFSCEDFGRSLWRFWRVMKEKLSC
jgi:hypothetical protein